MAAWKEVSAQGFADFQSTAHEQQKLGRRVFAYFSGDKEPESDGVSWCPDCVKGEGDWVGRSVGHLVERRLLSCSPTVTSFLSL